MYMINDSMQIVLIKMDKVLLRLHIQLEVYIRNNDISLLHR